jgi:hypothetical protein
MGVNADLDILDVAREYNQFLKEFFLKPIEPESIDEETLDAKVMEAVKIHKQMLLVKQIVIGGEEFPDAAQVLLEDVKLPFPGGVGMNYGVGASINIREYIKLSYEYGLIRKTPGERFDIRKVENGGAVITNIKLEFKPGLLPIWMKGEDHYSQGVYSYESDFGKSIINSYMKNGKGKFFPFDADNGIRLRIRYSPQRDDFISSVSFPIERIETGDIGAFLHHVGYTLLEQIYTPKKRALEKAKTR